MIKRLLPECSKENLKKLLDISNSRIKMELHKIEIQTEDKIGLGLMPINKISQMQE